MTEIDQVVAVRYLTAENAAFYDGEGILSLTLRENGEEKTYDRVLLCRCFPFDEPETHLSVTDTEQQEIGIIRDVAELSEESREACRRELKRRYFTRKILSVEKVKDRYGFTYWTVMTDSGRQEFALQDTFRSIIKVTPDHLLIQDVDANMFEIPSVEKLSRRSYRQIELYL